MELPEFDAPWWDLDENGNRINRFKEALDSNQAEESGFLNKLTMKRFEQLCAQIGLEIEKRSLASFQGSFLAQKISQVMIGVPGLREFFTAYAVYILSKGTKGH